MRVLRGIRYCVLPQSTSLIICCLLCVGAVATPPNVKPAMVVAHAMVQVDKSSAARLQPSHAVKIDYIKQIAIRKVDCTSSPCIALTFDDGPNRATTTQILSILEEENVPASFFIVGNRVAGQQDLLQRMHKDKFDIGNHSWNHAEFTLLNDDQVVQEIASTQHAIQAAGVPAPTLFRPPYGALYRYQYPLLGGLRVTLWNEDPRDWAAATSQQIIKAVLDSAKPGGVVDMHDIYQTTADALPIIIQSLRERGYNFVRVSDLMESNQEADNGRPFYGLSRLPVTPQAQPQPKSGLPSAKTNGENTALSAGAPVDGQDAVEVSPQAEPSF